MYYSPRAPPPPLSAEAAETHALLVYFVRSSFKDPSPRCQVCDLPPCFQKGRRDGSNYIFIKCQNHSAALLNVTNGDCGKKEVIFMISLHAKKKK